MYTDGWCSSCPSTYNTELQVKPRAPGMFVFFMPEAELQSDSLVYFRGNDSIQVNSSVYVTSSYAPPHKAADKTQLSLRSAHPPLAQIADLWWGLPCASKWVSVWVERFCYECTSVDFSLLSTLYSLKKNNNNMTVTNWRCRTSNCEYQRFSLNVCHFM